MAKTTFSNFIDRLKRAFTRKPTKHEIYWHKIYDFFETNSDKLDGLQCYPARHGINSDQLGQLLLLWKYLVVYKISEKFRKEGFEKYPDLETAKTIAIKRLSKKYKIDAEQARGIYIAWEILFDGSADFYAPFRGYCSSFLALTDSNILNLSMLVEPGMFDFNSNSNFVEKTIFEIYFKIQGIPQLEDFDGWKIGRKKANEALRQYHRTSSASKAFFASTETRDRDTIIKAAHEYIDALLTYGDADIQILSAAYFLVARTDENKFTFMWYPNNLIDWLHSKCKSSKMSKSDFFSYLSAEFKSIDKEKSPERIDLISQSLCDFLELD